MLSLRPLTRSAPRTLARLSGLSTRRPAASIRAAAWVQTQWKQTPSSRLAAGFHSSAIRRQEADDSGLKEELAAKLGQEIELEKDAQDPAEAYPTAIQEYLDNCAFELQDTVGEQEVHLVRQFGDETIKVTFSIEDFGMQNAQEDPDRALFDEEDDASELIEDRQSGGANTKGSVNQGRQADGNVRVAPEDRVAPADRPELSDEGENTDSQEESFPCRMMITVSRPDKGALTLEAMTQDGDTVINSLQYFPTKELAEPKTVNKDWDRRALYTGPPFGNLDEDLQILTERYLEERGINTSMALFIPEYIDFKEQREYVNWLENVKNFME